MAANPVTGVTVAHGSPSPAAGARTQYVVNFKASSTGGLSAAANSRITVTFPSGTSFGGYTNGAVFDVTSDRTVGSCGSPSGTVIECSLFFGEAVAAGDDVRVTFSGITNPGAGSPHARGSRPPPTPPPSTRRPTPSWPPTR